MTTKLRQNQSQNISRAQMQLLSLLRLSSIDLEARIDQEIERNPALEEDKFEEPATNTTHFNAMPSASANRTNQDYTMEALSDKSIQNENYLKEQINFLKLSPDQHEKILYLLGCLDSYGYLRRSLQLSLIHI